ncbi:MAG: imidazolonepropionase [Myxococcota bacterium]|nr:imidazolonepropionase [Myxococcota bacterium]MDW8363033.1 imidazolonepropionase [Myxococcales bacterium]
MNPDAPDLVVRNGRVVTCDGPGGGLGIVERGAVLCRGDRIAWVGPDAQLRVPEGAAVLDARGGCVLPGLVDPHTHLVFAGRRLDEFEARMGGEDYRAIAARGGGIASTVRATREASDAVLLDGAIARLHAMRAHGVTAVEVKSGYGLSHEQELRLLAVARALPSRVPVRVTTSLLAAHALPPERRDDRAGYVREIVERTVPEAAARGLADAVDVYCDEGAFDLEEARAVLGAARQAGLAVRAHAGQFRALGAAGLVASLGGLSADHLEQVHDEELRAMALAGTVAVLLPAAWRTLRQRPPDVERMRALGVRIAVGTDCNPGTSPCTDLPLCAALAVRDAGLRAEEAVLAMTAHAARAAGMADGGRIAQGARADLAIYPFDDPRILVYALGDVRASMVVFEGRLVDGEPAASSW